jgi:hypothetical protein
MGKLSNKQLQRALTSLAAANTKAFKYQSMIDEHCMIIYGASPSDIDNDCFIDLVGGGNGACPGMTSEEFNQSMRECLTLRKGGRG